MPVGVLHVEPRTLVATLSSDRWMRVLENRLPVDCKIVSVRIGRVEGMKRTRVVTFEIEHKSFSDGEILSPTIVQAIDPFEGEGE